jgi:hypothetical protein
MPEGHDTDGLDRQTHAGLLSQANIIDTLYKTHSRMKSARLSTKDFESKIK